MSIKVRISLLLSIIMIISILVITVLNKGITLYNHTSDKTATIINEVEPYDTTYIYNPNRPSTSDPIVISEGISGLDYTYDGLSYTHLSDKKDEIVEVGSGAAGLFAGRLTGYGPDCPGCSVVGNVSCKTREGKNHSLITDGINYTDSTYGSLRIIAADNSAFPCGTVMKINNGILDEFYAIVLDTGSTMRNAWKSGTVWIDLAFPSQAAALKGKATSLHTTFNVQRWGW